MRALVRRGVRETTNYTQTSPRGSIEQTCQFRYQRECPDCSRPVTQRGHALTHVQTQAKSTVEGRVIWPLLSLLCTAHAQYNYHGLSKHPVFDMYRKCLNCTGNVEVK